MNNLIDEPNLSFRVSHFNDILILAPKNHIRKSKPSKKSKPWMTPHMQAKIHTQDRFHQTIHQNWQEWLDTCHEANEATNKAKTESWKDLLQDAISNSDGPNMWKIIQGLKSTPDANSPNEAMYHDSWTITDIKSKANIFINHYARVSKLNISHSECEINWQFKKISTQHLLTMKAVLHFKWVNYFLPSERWTVKEQLALTTSHLHFSSHLLLWPSRNYYPYSTHPFHLLSAHVSGGLPPSFHYSKPGNLLVKSHVSVPSVSCHVSSNF